MNTRTYVIGIDLGGTGVKMGLFSDDGELMDIWQTATNRDPDKILPDIAGSIRSKCLEKGIDPAKLQGAGIGVPGSVDKTGIVNGCANIGWGRKDVSSELSALLGGVPVTCVNDANAAALGEMWRGSALGYMNSVLITIGTGLGAGVIVDGALFLGAFGSAGEIGHICIEENEERLCGCGKRGHLEQYVSATGIVRMAREALEDLSGDSLLSKKEPLDAKAVFDAARAGDELALALVDDVCRRLGRGLSIISCVLDPDVYILGGGVSAAGDILLEGVRKYFKHFAFHSSEDCPIKLAELGNRAGVYGSAAMVLDVF